MQPLVDDLLLSDASGSDEGLRSDQVDPRIEDTWWPYIGISGTYDVQLPVGCLPDGLRFLQFGAATTSAFCLAPCPLLFCTCSSSRSFNRDWTVICCRPVWATLDCIGRCSTGR